MRTSNQPQPLAGNVLSAAPAFTAAQLTGVLLPRSVSPFGCGRAQNTSVHDVGLAQARIMSAFQSRPVRASTRSVHARFSNRPFGIKHFQANQQDGPQRWNDVPRGTMDEVSSHVRLDPPFV